MPKDTFQRTDDADFARKAAATTEERKTSTAQKLGSLRAGLSQARQANRF
jgi:hypothetical protein